MVPIPPHSDDVVEGLRNQMRMIEERLAALENRVGITTPAPVTGAAPPPDEVGAVWGDAGSLAALLGKSLLGLALAYLLRALAESGSIAVPVGVGIGIVYALSWLLWAARTPAAETLTVSLRALTGVLVIVPLLWEAQVRFSALSSWSTAGMLVVFSVAGLLISWRKNLTSVAWITSLGGLGAAAALLMRTHELLPYTTALLVLALAVEVSACLEHYLGERWMVALFADLAVLLVTFVATRPAGMLQDYAPLGLPEVLAVQIGLVVIYLSSTIVRTLVRRFRITNFEVAQSAVAVAVAGMGAIRVASGHPGAVLTVGMFCALSGMACYVVSFAFLDHGEERDRNFHTYATFGLVLLLAGSRLLLPGLTLVSVWAALPVLLVLIGRGTGRSTLKVHGATYLLLAGIVSGAVGLTTSRFLSSDGHLAGTHPEPGAILVTASALLCYWLLVHGVPATGRSVAHRLASFALAATTAWMALGVAAALVGPLCRRMAGQVAPDLCPTLLTGLLVALSLVLSQVARQWLLPELRWISLLLTAVASYKLLFQDFRQAHTFALVLSLAAYGAGLILLPRLGPKAPKPLAAAH